MVEPSESSPAEPRSAVATWRDYLLFAAFAVVWLIPLTYKGVTHTDLVRSAPVHLKYLHNASCLFTKSVKRFSDYYAEGYRADRTWIPLRDAEFSPLQPSGHRSRMDWMLGNSRAYGSKKRKEAQWEAIARWYVRRQAELHPDEPPLVAVRLFYASYPVGGVAASGHWDPRPCEEIPDEEKHVLFTYVPKRGR